MLQKHRCLGFQRKVLKCLTLQYVIFASVESNSISESTYESRLRFVETRVKVKLKNTYLSQYLHIIHDIYILQIYIYQMYLGVTKNEPYANQILVYNFISCEDYAYEWNTWYDHALISKGSSNLLVKFMYSVAVSHIQIIERSTSKAKYSTNCKIGNCWYA